MMLPVTGHLSYFRVSPMYWLPIGEVIDWRDEKVMPRREDISHKKVVGSNPGTMKISIRVLQEFVK